MKKLQTNLTIVSALMSASITSSAMAAVPASAVVNVTTIADVSVNEETIMNFGSDIVPLAGTNCDMELTSSYTDEGSGNSLSSLDSLWSWSSGNECGGVTPQGGVFSISGSPDQNVTVTYTGDVDESVAIFTPDILYMGVPFADANQAGLADGGTESTLLAALDRINLGLATGITAVSLDTNGAGSLFVGGNLEIVNLAAGLDSTLTYTIDVVY